MIWYNYQSKSLSKLISTMCTSSYCIFSELQREEFASIVIKIQTHALASSDDNIVHKVMSL